ncbi:MAG: permease prefix domain 1-containing protein [Lachnospiraceae bacterium]|nr:permease prefix domain 1-containing protein [Lachnospiraceae bacterium]MDE7184237.1 permease prefix domain 1-containing protein [Lachnospiraceae bacterium]
MEEFMKTLTEQMRCVKARNGVARELTDHIADQAEAYEHAGMKHEEAVEKAVHEMGDPVEIGVSMDRIHRPQADWKMMLLTFVLSIAGIFCMVPVYGLEIVPKQLLIMLAAFAVILAVYFIDYSILGRMGVTAYFVLTVFLWLTKNFYFQMVNGRVPAMAVLVYLYVPVFAGILYQLRRRGYRAVLAAVAVIGITMFFALSFSSVLGSIFNLYVVMITMTGAAAAKGMFGRQKKGMTVLTAAAGLLPLVYVLIAACSNKNSFRMRRIMAFLNWSQYQNEEGYFYKVIHDILNHTKLVGGGTMEFLEQYPIDSAMASEMMPLVIVYLYGFIVGILLIGLLALLLVRAFLIMCAQKNQLGFLVSMSCFLVIFLNCVEGFLVSFAMLPLTTTTLPFLTRGASTAFVYAVFIGLILSVHRYEKVLTAECCASPHEPKWKLCIKVERR